MKWVEFRFNDGKVAKGIYSRVFVYGEEKFAWSYVRERDGWDVYSCLVPVYIEIHVKDFDNLLDGCSGEVERIVIMMDDEEMWDVLIFDIDFVPMKKESGEENESERIVCAKVKGSAMIKVRRG